VGENSLLCIFFSGFNDGGGCNQSFTALTLERELLSADTMV
jgi:hypothetical protein